jgi:hypothetical protein
MTALEALTPKLEVLAPTTSGKARSVRVYTGLRADGYECDAAVVIEEQGKGADGYGVTEVAGVGGGRAFRMKKAGAADAYTVFCAAPGGWSSCTCPAATYGTVRTCRHLAVCEAAIGNGWL